MKISKNATYLRRLMQLLEKELGAEEFQSEERAITKSLFKNLSASQGEEAAFKAIYRAFGHHGERMAQMQWDKVREALECAGREHVLV